MTLLSDSDSPLLCFSQKDGLSASFPPLLPPPPPPDFAVLSHGPSDLPDAQAPAHGGSIGASYFLIHCTLSVPLLCSKTVFGSLVLIHTSTRIRSPFCLSSLVSDQSLTMPFSFAFSKIGLPACPAHMLVSHLCTSAHPVLIALLSVLREELFTSRPATASLQLLASLSPTIAFSISSAVWFLC